MKQIDYSPEPGWIDRLLSALAHGVFVAVNGIGRETLRKRLYRRNVYAQVATNPGRGCIVRIRSTIDAEILAKWKIEK